MALYRHKKNGNVYEVINDCAGLECSAAPEFENMFGDDVFMVYRSVASGAWYVRPREEFLDGRFEAVPK